MYFFETIAYQLKEQHNQFYQISKDSWKFIVVASLIELLLKCSIYGNYQQNNNNIKNRETWTHKFYFIIVFSISGKILPNAFSLRSHPSYVCMCFIARYLYWYFLAFISKLCTREIQSQWIASCRFKTIILWFESFRWWAKKKNCLKTFHYKEFHLVCFGFWYWRFLFCSLIRFVVVVVVESADLNRCLLVRKKKSIIRTKRRWRKMKEQLNIIFKNLFLIFFFLLPLLNWTM